MSVRTRLVVTLSSLTALLAVPAVYGLLRLRAVRDIALELQGRDAAASVAVGRLEAALGQLDWSERSYIAVPEEESRLHMYAALDSAHAAIQDLREAGFGQEVQPAEGLLSVLGPSTARTEALVRAGRVSEATEKFEELKPVFGRAQEAIGPIAEAIDRRGAGAAEEARRISAAAARTTFVALLVALGIALLVGTWLTGSLTAPLRRLGSAMRRVAQGDLEEPGDLPYRRADELGDLSRSFGAMTRQLDELARLKAEFVSVATHELKTPLNVIAGYGEMLESGEYGPLADTQLSAVTQIHQQARILSRLVSQLLDLSRIEAGAFTIEMEPLNVGQLLHELERSFEPLAAQRGIVFTVRAEQTAPAMLEGDIDRLRNEVLGNLLSNAFKFTPRGGSVSLRARGGEEVVAFEVSDTGRGIDPDDIPRIFEKYYQPDRASRALGAGLGLAIAREVVLAHSGTIDVTSVPGEGTRFVVTLPRRQPERGAPPRVALSPPPKELAAPSEVAGNGAREVAGDGDLEATDRDEPERAREDVEPAV